MTKIEGQLSTSTMCLQSAQSPLSMKIARFGQDTDIARMAVPHRMAARRLRVPDLVGRAGFGIEAPFAAQRIEHRRPVDDVRRHQVDHPFLAPLHLTRGEHQPRRHDGAALALEKARPQQLYDVTTLHPERYEDSLSLPRPPARKNT